MGKKNLLWRESNISNWDIQETFCLFLYLQELTGNLSVALI